MLRLEHGGTWNAEGRYAEVPEGLGVGLPLYEDGISGVSYIVDAPFSVEGDFPS